MIPNQHILGNIPVRLNAFLSTFLIDEGVKYN